MTLRLVLADETVRDAPLQALDRDIAVAAYCLGRAKERLNELLVERDRLLLERGK